MERDTARFRTLDSGSLGAQSGMRLQIDQLYQQLLIIMLFNNVTMHGNTAHWWPRIPAEYSLQIAPICCYLPTHVHRGEMRQEGIRARYYLGFPQTGMKEGFVIARPLVGVASLHVRHTR